MTSKANLSKRIISVLLCLSILLSFCVVGVSAEEAADYSGELLQNPSFEDTGSYTIGSTTSTMVGGWIVNGGGYQKNNPKSGSYGFYLNNGTNKYIYQAVTIPYTGLYNVSAYIHQGGASAKLGIRHSDGTVISENVLPTGCNYTSKQTLEPVLLTQGDVVHVYCYGSASWTNGDDFSLTYDFSNVTQNLLEGMDLSSAVSVRAPWAGPYILTATVEAGEEDAVVTLGDESVTVAAGTTETVKLTSDELELNAMLDVSIGGTITEASLIFDVSVIPNEAPEASDVSVSGVLFSDEMIVGNYTFSDPDEGQKEGNSTYRWLVSDSADGEYTAVENAVSSSLTLDDSCEGKYIKFEVTPVDSYGKAGEPVLSEAAGPAHINYVRNAGMELESSGSSIGWGGSNGGSIPNKQSNSYNSRNGFKFGQIPAGDADASVYYGLTVALTGKFTLQAYVQTWAEAGTLGIRMAGSTSCIADVQLPNTNGEYQLVQLTDVAIERDTEIEVYVQGASGCSVINADDFALYFQGLDDMPTFTTLKSLEVEESVVVNRDVDNQTYEITVPYGTDLTALTVTALISDGAAITPASGSVVDFTEPVTFTITNGDAESVWVVSVKEGKRVVSLTSDNKILEDGFNWAANKTQQFVMTGQTGKVTPPYNYDHGYDDLNNVEYIPSYWAGYYNRTAFYARDFVHQAVGAQVVGLAEENLSMFQAYARSCTEIGGYWTQWALNFDGKTPYVADWWSETNFLHELPAQFEMVEKAYQQYLWSGDESYIYDEDLWNMYTHIMVDFVASHDSNGNGVAEAIDPEGFSSSVLMCSYNERSGRPLLESGDAFGAQYQATLAYAAMLEIRGETEAAAEWYQKAEDLLTYFNEEWSVKDGDEDGLYVHSLGKNGVQYNDFSKETSWFMPMKQLLQDNDRAQAYLTFIAEAVGDGIGDTAYSPANIEAWSYLPDVFFPYNRSEEAWKVMEYIISIIDEPHEIAAQGTNGDYPEISFTFVSSTIAGMMGVEPNAADHYIATASRLPSEVGYVKADYIQVGDHELTLEHDGLNKSVLTNTAEEDLTWEARFYGEYDYIVVDGEVMEAQQKDINGVTVSYVVVPVAADATVTASTATEQDLLVVAKEEAKAELEAERASYDDADYRDEQIDELDAAVETGLAAIEAAENAEAVNAAVEAAKAEMDAVKTDAELLKEELAAALAAAEQVKKEAEEAAKAAEQAQKEAEEAAKQAAADKEAAEQAKKEAEAAKAAAEAAEAEAALSAAKYDALAELTGYAETQSADVSEILKEAMAAIDAAESAEEVAEVVADAKEAMGNVVVPVCPSEQFTDVEKDVWYHEAVDYMIENGYMNGVSKDQFNVNGSVTRAQLVTILYRLEGEPSVEGLEHPFADVADGAWYNDAVIWAYDNEIVKGVSDTQFAPDKNISRQQIVTILYRYCGAEAVEKDHLAGYSDAATVAEYAAEAMNWAIANGIVNGMNDTTLAPNATASRAQIATILMRYLEK